MRQSRWPRVPMAEHREPCESRGSRTVLGAPGGEIPPGDSTIASIRTHALNGCYWGNSRHWQGNSERARERTIPRRLVRATVLLAAVPTRANI